MAYKDILFKKKNLLLVASANLLGTLFGFYYYFEQLMNTPLYLWIFVPASPLATLFIAASIYLNINYRPVPVLDALAFIGNFKYGLWTVFCLIYYFDIFFGANSTALYSFMLVSHFGMFLQSFLVFKWRNINWFELGIDFIWFEINDIIDYSFGTHTELYTDYVYPAEIAAFSLTITGFILGLILIQKDQILSKFRELRKV